MRFNRRKFIKKSGMAGASMAVAVPFFSFDKGASKNDTINVGVIGTGARGTGLIRLMREIRELNVIACCDILSFRLDEALRLAPKAQRYTDYRQLLENNDIDAVIIATPLYLHATMAIDSMDAGKHVYCEKTMAFNVEQTNQMISSVNSNQDLVFQVGHQYHNSRLYSKIVDLIRNNQIGTVTGFDCQWNRNGNWRKPVPEKKYERKINWRMYREYSCGLLAELSAHQIDFVNWATKSHPQSVLGTGGIDYWKDGRETFDNVHVVFDYPNGIKAKFTCTTANAYEGYQIKVLGDKATIVVKPESATIYPEIALYERETEVVDGVSGATADWGQDTVSGIPINIEHLDPSKQALIDFAESIQNNREPISNVRTGADTSFSVHMALEAMMEKKVVYWKY
ncbi:MAG: Gfo/Idh/MocA family oxidoreductase [Cyclobacteriaceae bacterium]|nr:Gfo/Idh/MocA family oxidoreductase [Cyclobacteriaceae bacterium SS2]